MGIIRLINNLTGYSPSIKILMEQLTFKVPTALLERSSPYSREVSFEVALTVAEYFAGIGLFRMGLEKAGWQVVFANDISEQKFEMYKAFYPDAIEHYKVRNIFKIHPRQVSLSTVATCSFPCIDLSLAGNMNGMNGKHSSAFWGFINILEAQEQLAPPIVVVENVSGWLSSNNGDDFRVTVKALNELGYACDVFVLDALRFRPQSRLRVFLIGRRFHLHETDPIKIFERPKSLITKRLKEAILKNQDLNWTYIDIPAPPPLLKTGLSEIIEEMDNSDARWWPAKEVRRHYNMMHELHSKRVDQLVYGEETTYRTFYRRVRNGKQRPEVRQDDISGCLRTAVGGSSKQFLLKAGRGELQMRNMTPREHARLQGVPDHFPIKVDINQALSGFGDAVCVPVISWIAENVLSKLVEELRAVINS